MKTQAKINRKKYPHRGIITEIAKEQGIKPPSVWEAIEVHKNPRIIAIYAQKLMERTAKRKEVFNNYDKAIQEAL